MASVCNEAYPTPVPNQGVPYYDTTGAYGENITTPTFYGLSAQDFAGTDGKSLSDAEWYAWMTLLMSESFMAVFGGDINIQIPAPWYGTGYNILFVTSGGTPA